MLLPQDLELLPQGAHLLLAALLYLRDLLLQGIQVLLYRSQSGKDLALLLQSLGLSAALLLLLGLGPKPLPIQADLLGLLGLGQLRLDIGQLLAETINPGPVFHCGGFRLTQLLLGLFQLRAQLFRLPLPTRQGNLPTLGLSECIADRPSKNEHGQENQSKDDCGTCRIEHMF